MNKKDRKEKLNELKKKFEDGEIFGLDIQKKGIRIVNACKTGKEFIDHVQGGHGLPKPDIDAWIAGANATIPMHPPQRLKSVTNYLAAVNTSATTGTVFLAAKKSLTPKKIVLGKNKQPKFLNFNKDYEANMIQLDKYLKSFSTKHSLSKDLVVLRRGAWDIYNSAIGTNVLSASHNMRIILEKIINKWASNKEVMTAKWWKKPKDKKPPNLRQRLRYLLFGPDKIEDESLDMVNKTVENACFIDEKLKKTAHGSKRFQEEIKNSMRIMEYTLLTIFQLRKLKHKRK